MENKFNLSAEETAYRTIKSAYTAMITSAPEEISARNTIADELFPLQKEDGSFRVIDSLRGDFDYVIGYAYEPSYYAVAALINKTIKDGEDPKCAAAIKASLPFTARGYFPGHGYDAVADELRALKIFTDAGVYTYINNGYAGSKELQKTICRHINYYREQVRKGETYYNFSGEYKDEFVAAINDYDAAINQEVWYACYGSNINEERFMKYIKGCTDQTAPSESRTFIFPWNICFAGYSSTWQGAPAYLDDSKEGFAMGRIYRITSEQFREIQKQEGSSYNKKVCAGIVDDIPVFTFTYRAKLPMDKGPSAAYLNTILSGLKEVYPGRSALALELYLYSSNVLTADDYAVLEFVRNSEHGVSCTAIAEGDATPGITRTRAAVKRLVSCGLLKQDRRSSTAGLKVNSKDSISYTNPEKRDIIDLLLLRCWQY